MGAKKKRTTEEYVTWLKQSFNSTWGLSYDQVLNYAFNNSAFQTKVNSYGVGRSWYENTGIPAIESILGKGSGVMFTAIVCCEGGNKTLGWINHTYRSGSALPDIKTDAEYIKDLLNSFSYPPALNDPYGGIPTMPNGGEVRNVLNQCSAGAIGRYYMCATLAGNACVWAESWANNYYFGNPYDQIMDMIANFGGDISKGSTATGSAPTGGNGISADNLPTDIETLQNMLLDAINGGTQALMELLNKLFPSKVYLNNSTFSVLGCKFRRYGQWLFITYPWENMPDLTTDIDYNGEFNGGNEEGDPSQNPSDWYAKIVAELDKIRNKSFWYSNARPAGDLTSINYTDCSGFAGWIARTAFPKMWNSGYTNTGTQLTTMKSIGSIVYSGSQSALVSQASKVKAGDFLIMGSEPSCGAGLQSHIAWVETPEKVWSMEGQGLLCKSLNTFLTRWWTPGRPYFNVCRPR